MLHLYYVCVTMKTKPTSIRFDENDLLLAQNLSGIKKPQKLVDLLIAEYVKPLKSKIIELPKDYMNVKSVGIIKNDGLVEKIQRSTKNENEVISAAFTALDSLNNDEIQKQIDGIKNELKYPPKNPSVGMNTWVRVREKKISELQKLLK